MLEEGLDGDGHVAPLAVMIGDVAGLVHRPRQIGGGLGQAADNEPGPAGHQHLPRRQADGPGVAAHAIGVAEGQAGLHQRVEVGGLDPRIAEGVDRVLALIVAQEEKDVGTLCGARTRGVAGAGCGRRGKRRRGEDRPRGRGQPKRSSFHGRDSDSQTERAAQTRRLNGPVRNRPHHSPPAGGKQSPRHCRAIVRVESRVMMVVPRD